MCRTSIKEMNFPSFLTRRTAQRPGLHKESILSRWQPKGVRRLATHRVIKQTSRILRIMTVKLFTVREERYKYGRRKARMSSVVMD